jgi:hypothetical protein
VGNSHRQAVAARLLAEVVELLLAEAPVEEGAGVDAGGGVALDVELVAGAVPLLAVEEVVEAGLVQPGRRGEGGDVAADAEAGAAGDHRGRVPAVPGGDPGLHLQVAVELGLGGGRDGVDVIGLQQLGQRETGALGVLQRTPHQVRGAVRARGLGDGVQGGRPFGGLLGVTVRELVELARKLSYGVGHDRRLPEWRGVEKALTGRTGRWGRWAREVNCRTPIDDRSKGEGQNFSI